MAMWRKKASEDEVRGVEAPAEVVEERTDLTRQGRPIVMIHGMNMPRLHLLPLGRRLRKMTGRPVKYFPFTSRVRDIPDTACRLADWLDAQRLAEFDAVTHSIGGVVLRWAMTHCTMPRLRRAVMVAPPNEGTIAADKLHRRLGPVFTGIFGQAGLQLRRGELGIAARAGCLPDSQTGVIAGGAGSPEGIRNWLKIPGDCDGTVAVEETIFPGMTDFVMIPCDHTSIAVRKNTAALAWIFLETGQFRPRRRSNDESH